MYWGSPLAKYWSVNQRKPPENNSYKDCSNQGTVQVPTSKNEKEKKKQKKNTRKNLQKPY